MPENKFNYVIGDIHGCYDELIRLEERIENHAQKNEVSPFIISVGDLVDRGDKSKQVIEHFIQGIINNTHYAVMGNHELLMIQAIKEFAPHNFSNIIYPEWLYCYEKNYKERRGVSMLVSWENYRLATKAIWLNQGGASTMNSFDCDPVDYNNWKIPEYILDFLANLPFYYESDNFIVTHALPYPEDLEFFKQSYETNLNSTEARNAGHTMVWNRTMPEANIHTEKLHISGHTPLFKVKKSKKANAIQIDTSCVFGGRLTAYCVETNELISVKANKNYIE